MTTLCASQHAFDPIAAEWARAPAETARPTTGAVGSRGGPFPLLPAAPGVATRAVPTPAAAPRRPAWRGHALRAAVVVGAIAVAATLLGTPLAGHGAQLGHVLRAIGGTTAILVAVGQVAPARG